MPPVNCHTRQSKRALSGVPYAAELIKNSGSAGTDEVPPHANFPIWLLIRWIILHIHEDNYTNDCNN